jgi:hypothetical protein
MFHQATSFTNKNKIKPGGKQRIETYKNTLVACPQIVIQLLLPHSDALFVITRKHQSIAAHNLVSIKNSHILSFPAAF